MSHTSSWRTPREDDLRLRGIANELGLAVSVLSNGSVFAIEHRSDSGTTLINQVLASPLDGGIGRVLLRAGGSVAMTIEAVGPRSDARIGFGVDCAVWESVTRGIRHRVTLQLVARTTAWLWRVEVTNASEDAVPIDAILLQDLGLGARGFVTNNEAYASQYIDHHIAHEERHGCVVMSRQNLAQNGKHPWVMHGCFEGATAFATDAMQLFGMAHRDADGIDLRFGTRLADRRLQHEAACVAVQSFPATLEPGASVEWRFFALFVPDHSTASTDGDIAMLGGVEWPGGDADVSTSEPRRSVLHRARPADVASLTFDAVAQRYPDRVLHEHDGDRLLSFFVPDGAHNRHVVLRDKERIVTRRHGALLRSGGSMLPDESTLCATCWMHGVFAAQLTIGNTSFHKLFSVSRDPYNVMRANGLRAWVDTGSGWCSLAVPSAFDMGLSDCRWIYALADRTITVRAIASANDAAMQWRITIEGDPCRLLIVGHLVLGEREFEHAGIVAVDAAMRRFTFRPDPGSLWGERYRDTVYHLVTSTPQAIDAIGGDELLYADAAPATGAYIAMTTLPTRELCFAVVGSLDDPQEAARLASAYEQPLDDGALVADAMRFWTRVTRGWRVAGEGAVIAALDASLPWLVHDAMIHLTVPRGLEQYTGAAWGTRDVCQGPVEFLLAFEHDEPVKVILRTVFAQQYETRGDWPQWFMLEPYASIQDRQSHGDVIVWPLKALNDYLEATGDVTFLDERVPWRDDDTLERSVRDDTIAQHVDKLLATVRERFIPGTHLVRYGEGDWNDSLQPADSRLRDTMASSWTVALLYQQLVRYADVLRRVRRNDDAGELTELAAAMRDDFNRFLVRDGTVAGYGVFDGKSDSPELLLHPSDVRTGLRYSLLPMTRSIIAGLFTPEQAQHHLRIIREQLLFPDGVRLIDRPVVYRGGVETIFRRAESAAFFGREIGLMYVHAHLRYAEAVALLGDADALYEALIVANPIGVTDRVANAARRQRNAYFSSSDATFADRYEASAAWPRVRAGTIIVDGGWRIYSSGPGLYANVLIRHALGARRAFGHRVQAAVVPSAFGAPTLVRGP